MKLINNTIIILSLIVSILTKQYLLFLGLIPILFISLLIRKYNKNLEFVYLVFVYFAYVLGFVYDYYDKVYFYDALVHSLFGLVASIYALPLLKLLKKYDLKNRIFNVIFIIIFTLAMASVWEIFEFTIDKITGTNDMQRGLNNTMKDIISALLFSILYCFVYIGKPKLFERLFITKN